MCVHVCVCVCPSVIVCRSVCPCVCVSVPVRVCVLVWAVCSPAQEQALLHFLPAVHTLSRVSALHIHCPLGAPGTPPSAPPPEGCIVGTVDHSCQLHLKIQVMEGYNFWEPHVRPWVRKDVAGP